jgi:hypothetical protein
LPRPSSLSRIVALLPLALGLAVCARPARAESGNPAAAETAKGSDAPPRPFSLRGFDVLATAGWGASTANIRQLKLEPYGASFGFDAGYTWPSGFRLGAYFSDSLGVAQPQHREPRVGPEDDFVVDTSSVSGGLSVGWAVPVYALVLRYTLSFGVTAMRWEIADSVASKSVSIGNGSSPTVGVHFAPGVALLWPYRWFEAGVGFDYMAQVKDTIPTGFVGKVLVGVKL